MFKSLNTAATGMQAQQANMDVIANNMANVNTMGFKKARAEFEDLMYQTLKEPGAATGDNAVSPNGVQIGLGVRTAATQRNFDPGAAKITGNPFDLQVEGPGFFTMQTPDGETVYTRDGSFKRDPTGRLVDRNGNLIQPVVQVPGDSTGVEISATGEVKIIRGLNTTPEIVGQIDVTNFVNPGGLRAIGKNLFTATESSGLPQTSRPGLNGVGYIAQGQLESSNVNIVDEMVNMITAQRAYETNSKVIQAVDQMLQGTNNLR